jgi:hypothetical protein
LLLFDAAEILGSLMNYSVIGRDEILGGKPFTDPELTRREAKVMRGMLARERERVQAWQEGAGGHAGGQVERDYDEEERRHLLVVPDTEPWRSRRAITTRSACTGLDRRPSARRRRPGSREHEILRLQEFHDVAGAEAI